MHRASVEDPQTVAVMETKAIPVKEGGRLSRGPRRLFDGCRLSAVAVVLGRSMGATLASAYRVLYHFAFLPARRGRQRA